ncbi:MAG TPA: hypothetical protein VK167_04250 [Flavipsychrobacter sp.]|nr:hypothetical protein [Flavipsychrobacter sp.]
MEFKNILEIFNESKFFSLVEKTHEILLIETDYGHFQLLATRKNGFRIIRKEWESSKRSIISDIKHVIVKELEAAIDNEYLTISNIENNVGLLNTFIDIVNTVKAGISKHNYLNFCQPVIEQIDRLLIQSKHTMKSITRVEEYSEKPTKDRVVCNLNAVQLGNLLRDISRLISPINGKNCIEGSTKEIAEAICQAFVGIDGKDYDPGTIRRNMESTSSRYSKRYPAIKVCF